jgi:hypothetical protein
MNSLLKNVAIALYDRLRRKGEPDFDHADQKLRSNFYDLAKVSLSAASAVPPATIEKVWNSHPETVKWLIMGDIYDIWQGVIHFSLEEGP